MRVLYTFIFVVLLYAPSNAQFFSGKYYAEPEVLEFEHVKIHHHHVRHDKYHGDLSLTAYSGDFMLWEAKAKVLDGGYKAAFFKEKFARELDVQTVYELKVALDGIEEDYILMGYENQKGHGAFLVIEEIFENDKEEDLMELEKFSLVQKRDHKHK